MKTIKNISMFLAVATIASLFSPATLAIEPPIGQASYTYDTNNRLTKVVYSNARTVNFTYDNNGNLTNLVPDGGTKGIVLNNGTALTGISGSEGGNRLYTFVVPKDPVQTLLEIKTSGGTGDCDLEVSDSAGNVNKYSLNSGNSETIRIPKPAAGTWMINLIYRTDVSGLSLVAKTYTGAPSAPAGLKATDGTFADKIVLTWTEAVGVSSYSVYRNDTGTTSAGANPIAEVQDTTYTDTAATDNTKTYTYFVKSKRADTESILFSTGDVGYVTKVPVAPTTVTASDGTYFDKIRVTWKAVTGASSYDIKRYTDAILNTSETVFADVTGLTYDDGTCDLNKTYYYSVIAKINNVPSVESKRNAGILSSKGPATIKATSGTLYNIIRVTWAPVPGATSYDIYVDYVDNTSTVYDSTTSTTYDLIRDPIWRPDHDFRVKAKYTKPDTSVNESDFSPVANGKFGNAPKIPAAPVLKSVSTDLYTFIRVTWGEVATAEQYNIYRSEGTVFSGAGVPIDTVNAPILTYDDLNAKTGTKYNYWVTAVNTASTTQESKPSAMMSGRAAADIEGGFPLSSGTPVAGISDTIGKSKYYSIIVPTGTTRLVATLTGTDKSITNDCDLYLKLGSYPTKTSFNVKGTESASGETATVSNPVDGTWYIMLYAVTDYATVTLQVDCYSAADIILTQVPLNNQTVPFAANFKGRVVDKSDTGIVGLNIKVRDPIKRTTTTLATKTDKTGYFTYSTTVNLEGEHTYDFFFDEFPETGASAKGTASHTVGTRIGASVGYDLFDSSSYLPATPVALADLADTIGMQTFLNIRNGWDPIGALDPAYEKMWVESTVINTPNDEAITSKGIDGLFIVFYGVNGAGAGNDSAANSVLSNVPLMLHVTPGANLTTVLNNLVGWGMINGAKKDEVLAGGLGVVSITVIDPNTNSDQSMLPDDELSLISGFITNTDTTSDGTTAIYSGGTPNLFTVTLNGEDIKIVAIAY